MPFTESRSEVVRNQLEKVLSSAGFARNERLSGFLRFVIEQELSGKGEQLKEAIVGVEVFGRRPDYDVRQDSVVRTEAAKLRARLARYYAAEGAADSLIIELPKGGYKPRIGQKVAEVPDLRFPSRRLWLAGALVGLAVALLAIVGWRVQYKRAPIPIAVLPLTNLSQDPANEYFADGLTDEIIRNLSIIDGLAVRSQTSSFAFKGKPRNVSEAGKQLAVDYILEGSVLRAGQHLRINAQLVRVRDDFPVWSGRYDRELADVFAIQDEISRDIVNSLRLKLGRGQRRYETSAEAYDLYLRARALPIQRGLSGYNESIGPLEKAIAKDPSFAPAYAGLAVAHAARSGQFKFDLADEASKMRAAADRAIQLDPLLAEAHRALGLAYARDGRWEQSEKSFRRALEIDPSSSMSRGNFAMSLLLPLGRIEEALHELRVAEKTDSLSPLVQFELAYVLISAGRYDEAAGHCEKLPEGNEFDECLGRARLGQGRFGGAIQILAAAYDRGVSEGSQVRGELGYAYARASRRQDAEKLAASTSSLNPFNRALIFAGLGDKDRTLEALDRATTGGSYRIGRALTFPEFALLRGDPRLKALRKKVGLPE
jgi:TolB-like protein/Flp pilus assembly protein TadD